MFKTGLKTENGIISPIFLPRNKKLILQNVLHFYQGFQSQYLKQEMKLSKQEMELSKQEMELFEVIIATLGSILDSQLSWESGKFQLARWSHEVVLLSPW